MSDAKKCDRCGKFYEKNSISFERYGTNIINGEYTIVSGLSLTTQFPGVFKPYDLCDECLEQLIDWLECQKKGENDGRIHTKTE